MASHKGRLSCRRGFYFCRHGSECYIRGQTLPRCSSRLSRVCEELCEVKGQLLGIKCVQSGNNSNDPATRSIPLSVTISAFFRIDFWPAWLSPRMRLSSPDHAPLIARTRVLAICSFCRFSSYNTASGRFYQPGETFMTHLTYS